MGQSSFSRFHVFSEHLLQGVHNFDADTLKVYFSNTPPVVNTMRFKADLPEIAAVNGYPAGGVDVQAAWSRAGAVLSVIGQDVTVPALGGPYGPFRYVVLYNNKTIGSTVNPLIGFWSQGPVTISPSGDPGGIDFGDAIFSIGP